MARQEQSESLQRALEKIAQQMAATRKCISDTEHRIKRKKNKLVSVTIPRHPNPDNPTVTYFEYPSQLLVNELYQIACALVADGKGIIGSYDSEAMLNSRIYDLDLENVPEQRRRFRQILCTTQEEICNYVSGILLTDESVHQKSDEGVAFTELLKERCVIPGVVIDTGVVTLFSTLQECTTEGLDDLGKRCVHYKNQGCHFAKWRSIFRISTHTPSYEVILENCNKLARFACTCQANRLVPIIQIDILHNGNYTISECRMVSEAILTNIYTTLRDHHVYLEGTLLKINMVMPGISCTQPSTPEEIVEATVTTLSRTVPCAVPGILFSGGEQDALDICSRLNSINRYFENDLKPWQMTFAFGRTILDLVFDVWDGKDENLADAQSKFLQLAKNSSEASCGLFEFITEPGHLVKPTGYEEFDSL